MEKQKGFSLHKEMILSSDERGFSFIKIDMQKVKEIQQNTEECKEMIEKWLEEV
jgi:hypothetical protein